MKDSVVCRKGKFDGTEKACWHGDLVAAEDDWLVVFFDHPAHRTEAGEPVSYALRYYSEAAPLSILVSFNSHGEVLEYQCDAGLPAEHGTGEIRFTDLDLDLMVTPSLDGRVRDEDTFAIHRFVMGYPEEVVALARAGVALAESLLRSRAEPFDGSAPRRLAAALGAEGAL